MRLLLLVVLVLGVAQRGSSVTTTTPSATSTLTTTPTPSPTPSGSPTPSLSPSSSASGTETHSGTTTPTPSASPSGSPSPTQSSHSTGSSSPTPTLTTVPTATPAGTLTLQPKTYFSTTTQRASAAQDVGFAGTGVGDPGEKLSIIPTSVNCGVLNTNSELERIPIGGGEKDLDSTTKLARFDFTGVDPGNYRACFRDNNPSEYVNDRNVVIPILPATVPTLRGPTGGGAFAVQQNRAANLEFDGGDFSPIDTVRFVEATTTGCDPPLGSGAIVQNDLHPVTTETGVAVQPQFTTANTQYGVCYKRASAQPAVFQRLDRTVIATPAFAANGLTAANEVSSSITGCTGQFADTNGVTYSSGITNPPAGAVVRAYPVPTGQQTCVCGDVGSAGAPATIQSDGRYTVIFPSGGMYTLCYADDNIGTSQQQNLGMVNVFSNTCSNALGGNTVIPSPPSPLPVPAPPSPVPPTTTLCASGSSDDDDGSGSLWLLPLLLGLSLLSACSALAALCYKLHKKKDAKPPPPPPAPAPIVQTQVVSDPKDKETIARLEREILFLKSQKPATEVKYVEKEVVKQVMVPSSPRVIQAEAADVEVDDRLLQEKKELIHQLKSRVAELENEPRGVVAPDPRLVQRLQEAEREIVYLEGELANTRAPVTVAVPVPEPVRVMEEPILFEEPVYMEEPVFVEEPLYYGGYQDEYTDPHFNQISAPPTTPAGMEYGVDYIHPIN